MYIHDDGAKCCKRTQADAAIGTLKTRVHTIGSGKALAAKQSELRHSNCESSCVNP